MRTPDISYSSKDFQNIEQRCPHCNSLLRFITEPMDYLSKTGKCGRCGKMVKLGSVFMRDRFSGLEFFTHDFATASAAQCRPWNQEDLVNDDDLHDFLNPPEEW